ncbi:Laminin G, subdomain protein 2 domain protein [Candidatus Magnetomorum sp. HK-1]|nr:Laminin G, subdomain protein 2 domain protein [Candidatus Magnetomorum sp. HK-1]
MLICFAFSSAQAGIYDGLVAWYPFDGDAKDASGNGNHGTVHGAILNSGVINNAYKFDGNDDYISIPDSSLLNFGSNSFSICAWIKNNQTGTGKRIITKRKNASDGNWYSLLISNGLLMFEINSTTKFTSTIKVNDNQWHFIVISRNKSLNKCFIYIDAVYNNFMDDNNLNLNSGQNISLEIGRWATEKYSGCIDDIRIYNRSIYEKEIQELFKMMTTDHINLNNGLIAHYEFENNLNDSSGNEYNIISSTQNYKDCVIGKGIQLNNMLAVDSEISKNILSSSIYKKQFSISCWAKFNSINNSYNQIITNFDNSQSSPKNYCFQLVRVRSGLTAYKNKLIFQIENGSNRYTISSKNEMKSNTNYFCTVSLDTNQLKLYINGELQDLIIIEGTINELSNPIYLGDAKGIDEKLNGTIDDLRIYNRALTQTEINALYFLGTGQIVNNITEQNTQNSDLIALKDLIKKDSLYYGVDDTTLYVSKNGDTYISLHESNNMFNALAATKNHVIAVGEAGQIILYNIINQSIEPITLTASYVDFLDIDSNGNNTVMIAGQNGTIVKGYENNFKIIDTDYGDITSMTYDKLDNKFYATTADGKLLSSTDGQTWDAKHITESGLTSFEKEGQIMIITGNDGKIYRSDNGREFIEATLNPNTTDYFVDVWFVKDRFIAATQDNLYSSDTGHTWLKINQHFTGTTIQKLFVDPNDQTLFVLTVSGTRKLSIFKNIETGKTKKATLAGVNVRFENSEIEYEQGQIKAFHIAESDIMYIYDNLENELAYMQLSNASFQSYSENDTTLDSILFKKQSYIEITGRNNILYYKTGKNDLPVSQGSFWLKNKLVLEKPLFNAMSDQTEKELEQEIDDFISSYTNSFNQALNKHQLLMISPPAMNVALSGLLKIVKYASKNLDIPLTSNTLLLGDLDNPFSPIYLSSPFCRRLSLDTTTGTLNQKDSYLFGGNFMAKTLIDKLKLQKKVQIPKLEYEVKKNKMTGSINGFKLEIDPITLETEKASLEVDLENKDETNTISINNALFTLTTMAASKYTQNTANCGMKVSSLKFTYDETNGFKLISGEAGGQVNIKELAISPTWKLSDIHTYFNILFREKNKNEPGFTDKYPDELDELIVVLGGKGKLKLKRQSTVTNDLSIEAGMELALDGDNWGFYNLQKANLVAKDWFEFPKAGAFSLTGVGGGYQYMKKGPSYWHLTVGFNFYKAMNNIYLFGGSASIYTDSDFESFGFAITGLKTPVPGTDLEMKWAKNNASICLLAGNIRNANPVTCPNVTDCEGKPFALKPSTDDEIFKGIGLGANMTTDLMDTKKNKPYEILGVAKVEGILSGKGTYLLSYQHTGNERVTIFGANQEPQGSISLSNQSASFQLTDAEGDPISYEIGLADENDNEITVLKPEINHNGETSFEITDVSYLPSGNYRVFMRYHDGQHPHKICMSTETIHIEKVIPQPQNIQSIITNDFVDIQWDMISGTEGYTVTLYNDNTSFYEMPTKSSQTRIYYLSDGNYEAKIQGYDMDGFSGSVGSIQFSIQKQAKMTIPKPIDDIGFHFDGIEARLTWNKPQETDFFQLTLKKGSQIILDQLITSQTHYTIDPSFYGEKLYVEIISKNTSNNSSEIFSKTIPIMDIIPYVKDDDIIDPYIFNYGSSIWTDLITGETFDPIYRKRMIPNDDQSYKIQTKETGILVFANRPDPIELKPVTQIFATNRVYYVDLASYQLANGLKQIEDITVETNGIVNIVRGLVSGNDEIRLDVIQPGRTECSIMGINEEGNHVRYTYLLDIIRTPPENNLIKSIAALQICAGIDLLYDLSEIDINLDDKISLNETIYWLQKVSENKQ